MSDQNTGHQLLNLQDGDFVRLSGDDPVDGDWHVNEHFILSAGDEPEGMLRRVISGGNAGPGVRHGYILQPADATPEWLAIVVDETHEGGVLDTVAHFDSVGGVANGLDAVFDVDSIAASADALGE